MNTNRIKILLKTGLIAMIVSFAIQLACSKKEYKLYQQAVPDSPQPQLQSSVPQMLEFNWSAGPAMPQGMQDNSVQVIDNWLVSVGGFCGGYEDDWKPGIYPRGFLNKVWGLDLANEAAGWIELTPLPTTGRQGMVSVRVNNKLYVWGGFNYTAPFTYKDGYRLSLKDGKWIWDELPPLPLPLTWAGAYAVGSRIYVLGGADYDYQRFYSLTDHTGDVKRLGARLILLDTDNINSGWQELAPCPGTPRCLTASAVVDGKIYSIGGVAVSDSGAYLNVVDSWRYDPASDFWERLRDFPMSGTGSSPGILVYQNRYILLPAAYQYENYMKPDGSVAPKYGTPSMVERTW
ncbi:MAG: hypothetical protein K8R79_11745 [Calditrichales bacterium]|nr:hypothetical protein [Calditrichales bacterium]